MEQKTLRFIEKMESCGRFRIVFLGSVQIALLGALDYLTGYEISFSFFYLIPVAFLAWFADRRTALGSALLSAVLWQVANYEAGQTYSSSWIFVWNTLTRLGFFIVVTLLLVELKRSLIHEKRLARTDHLTGAANARSFYETARLEIQRSRRYRRRLTVCYLDADNFKQVNDTLGHHTGSELLVRVVRIIRETLRATDVIARIGGDEFAILLPETDREQARHVVDKLRRRLRTEMEKENWPVTFSIGVLTCGAMPGTVDELIRQADALMYEVKNNGKDSVRYRETQAGLGLAGPAVAG